MNDSIDLTIRAQDKDVKLATARELHNQLLTKELVRFEVPFALSVVWSISMIIILSVVGTSLVSELRFGLIALPWIFFILYLSTLYVAARQAFWQQIALKYGWKYESFIDTSSEKGILFSQGYAGHAQNKISGTYKNHPFTIFEYRYSEGQGKNVHTFFFTVFEIAFKGTFPHIYLNYKHDDYAIVPNAHMASLVQTSVPTEFQNNFKLYVPQKYEMEALEIFTPEIFALLLDKGWNYDMEFVDGELILYQHFKFSTFESLDTELTKIKEIVDILAPRLNRMKLTEIGDLPSLLTKV